MEGFVSDQVINGTWGELWVDDTYMAEVTSFKLEINAKYTAISRTRSLMDGQKLTGVEAKGEVKLHKISSFLAKKVSDGLKAGKVPNFKIISKLSDQRVNKVEDVVNIGDEVTVKVVKVDTAKGRIDLSLRASDLAETKN